VLITLPESLSFNYNKLAASDVRFCLKEQDVNPKLCMPLYLLREAVRADSFWAPYISILFCFRLEFVDGGGGGK